MHLKPGLYLKDLEYDEEGLLHIELVASNGYFVATHDFYTYAEELEEFASRLQIFPKSTKDKMKFEVGMDVPDHYCHVVLTAYVYDEVGHCALEVQISNRGSRHVQTQSKFNIVTEPAQLNRLGETLDTWLKSNDKTMEWLVRA
jgi:hypothetical protein